MVQEHDTGWRSMDPQVLTEQVALSEEIIRELIAQEPERTGQ